MFVFIAKQFTRGLIARPFNRKPSPRKGRVLLVRAGFSYLGRGD